MTRAFALATTFVFLTLFVLISALPACTQRCHSIFDCGEGEYCTFDHRCQTDCYDDKDCTGIGFRCAVAKGQCVGNPIPPEQPPPPPGENPDGIWEGYDDPPNSGATFVMSGVGISDRPDRGMNVDGSCRGPGDCVDNLLSGVAGYANETINNGVIFGETLIIVELAGLDRPFNRNDAELTVKIYGAIDADDPPQTHNNFVKPADEARCCEFYLDPESAPAGQALARIRAHLSNGILVSDEPSNIAFTLAIGKTPHQQIHIDRARIQGRVSSSGESIREGLIGGAVPMASLASVDATPFCLPGENCAVTTPIDRTVLDIVSGMGLTPDIDLDLDGLECVLRQSGGATIDACCDGHASGACTDGVGCTGVQVPAAVMDQPASCALDGRMRDGYSVGLAFDAVQATVLGFKQ